MLKDLFGYSQFNLCTVQIMAYNVIILIMQSVVTYYATYINGSSAMSTTYLAAYLVGMLLSTALLTKPLDNKLGHKKTMLIGALLFAVSKIPFVLAPDSMICAIINFAVSGIGGALLYVTIFVYYSNVGDLIEYRCGKRMDACLGSVSGFVMVIASAIATEIIALSLEHAGFDAELAAQPEAAITTIKQMLGWIPLVLAVLMLVVTWLIRIDKDMEQMKAAGAQEETAAAEDAAAVAENA